MNAYHNNLGALHNLMNAQYGRSNSIPGSEKQNLAWARDSLERALKAIDAREKERANPGMNVDSDYITGADAAPQTEAL